MNKQQLAAKIWESANRMRSKIEANEYKDYILGFIFYKYLSDKEEQWLLSQEYTPEDIKEYVNEDDDETVRTVQKNLGYFIAYKDLFSTWIQMGADFSVDNVRTALSSFTRLISPSHKKYLTGFLIPSKQAFLSWVKTRNRRRRPLVIWHSLLTKFRWIKSRTMTFLALSMNI